jgi:cysteine desulfurase/selenocysteine lyase
MDIEAIRADFHILKRRVHDLPLVYLDSAATSQKPQCVIQAEVDFYSQHNAAANRGAHVLAEEATEAHEGARAILADFVGAKPDEIIFTRSATDSINMVATAFANATMYAQQGLPVDARFVLNPGDSIVVTELEHHANLVPWQELCKKTGAQLRWVTVSRDGSLQIETLESLVDSRTKLVAWTHVSNLLGHQIDHRPFVAAAQRVGALTLLDACQSVPHMSVAVPELGVDFMVWSAHKMLGPTGLGFLWGTKQALAAMPVVETGGSMIAQVTMESSTYLEAPAKFEPGVPAMAQTVAAGVAARYLMTLGMAHVESHVRQLSAYAAARLGSIPGVTVLTSADGDPVSAVSFMVDGIHPHDVGQLLDSRGIAVRVGHHCAWPLIKALGVPATVRASFSVYSTHDEIDQLVDGVIACQSFFSRALSHRGA